MKKLIIIISMLFSVAYGQTCDTVTTNAVSNITTTTARVTATGAFGVITYNIRYVRQGYTDTAGSADGSTLKYLTGLQAGTKYIYYYSTFCGTSTSAQYGRYTFTTLSAQVQYTPMASAGYQFKYAKVDSGFHVPFVDTVLNRAALRPGAIVIRSADSLFYGWNGVKWSALATDSFGIMSKLNSKVDSVIISPAGDSLFYWIDGVSYGQIFSGASSRWDILGNASTVAGTNFIGTTDAVGFDIRTNNTIRQSITSGGNVGIGTTTPISKLQVSGAIRGTDSLILTGIGSDAGIKALRYNTSTGSVSYADTTTGGGATLYSGDGTISADRTVAGGGNNLFFNSVQEYRLNSDTSKFTALKTTFNGGNVGIGTSTPTAKLHVYQDALNFVKLGTGGEDSIYSDNGIIISSGTTNVTLEANDNILITPTGLANVGIGTTTPGFGAKLDISSTDRGLLIPRLTTTQRNAITTPATGLLVWNTTDSTLNQYRGLSGWSAIGGGGSTYSAGYGLSLATTTFSADTAIVSTKAFRVKGTDSLGAITALKSTTLSNGWGLLGGGDLSANRTYTADTVNLSTKANGTKQRDSVVSLLSSYLPLAGATYTTTSGNGLALTSSTVTSGNLVSLTNTGTAAASNTKTVLNIASSGANGTASQTTYGLQVANTNTGSGTNVGGTFSASGGTNNYGLLVPNGRVGIGLSAPAYPLDLTISASGGWGANIANGNSNVTLAHSSGFGIAVSTGSSSTSLYGLQVSSTGGIDFKVYNGGQVYAKTSLGVGIDPPTSRLQTSGSFATGYVAKTANYTATISDYTIDCTSGTFTVTLPTASSIAGRIYVIKNSGTGSITVDANASETIDGALTYTLGTQYKYVSIQSTGSAWIITANN